MSDNVRNLVRWKDGDEMAIIEQLAERVRLAKKEGTLCGVVTCFVWQTTADDGEPGNGYDVGFSPLPVEVVLWAAEKIRERALK